MPAGEFKMKISLLGDGAVGKTCLIKKYVFDTFSDDYLLTLGTKTTRKALALPTKDGSAVNLTFMIWDIMGQKEFERLHSMFFQGSKGAIVVCDITRKETLKSLQSWVSNLYKVTKEVPLVFAINKFDLAEDEGQYTIDDVNEIASKYETIVLPTSAKTGLNVDKAFYELGKRLLDPHYPGQIRDYPKQVAPPPVGKAKEKAPEKRSEPKKEKAKVVAPPPIARGKEPEPVVEEEDEEEAGAEEGGRGEKFSEKLKRLMLERRKKMKELEDVDTQIHKLLVMGAKKLQKKKR